ncbi:Lipid A export ATP-binding/permease protein MsbA [Chitinispirillum alkaliphilum]|nr:Lipid A export ATP-binding/permease protein MsbA [Chitinispirillum alkaliphilum]
MTDRRLEEDLFKGEFRGHTFLRILKFARPHWPLMAGFLVAITFTAFLDSLNTYISRFVIDRGVIPGDAEQLLRWGGILGGFFLLNSLSFLVFFTCAGRLGELLQYDIRRKMFEHLQAMSFSFFDKTSSGWLLSRITSDSQRIARLASWMFLDIVWGSVNIVLAFIFMASMNIRLTLILGAVAPLLVFTALLFKRRIIVEFRKVRAINSRITHAFSENIAGVKVVKALNREEKNLNSFQKMTHDIHSASFRAGWLSALFLPLVQFITTLGVAAILLAGGWQLMDGYLSPGEFRAFIGYITFMMWPVLDLARVMGEMQQSVASAERVFTLLDTHSEIKDSPGAMTKAAFVGSVEFQGVTFSYNSDNPVIKGIDLKVEPGQMVALIGPTGGGKSTMVNLVARFYEPLSGRILFDGRDYRDYTQAALQSRIGVVLQHPHLFSGTVRDNIIYGNLDASERQIIDAAMMANAHESICSLPGGYESEVGEGGSRLSIGQRQLISLARVFVSNPDLIIMDEATSSIDSLTEHKIQQGITTLLKGRTSFIIAHRLSTIRNADRILVIEGGHIVEDGCHEDLLKNGGSYHSLYTTQMKEEWSAALGF